MRVETPVQLPTVPVQVRVPLQPTPAEQAAAVVMPGQLSGLLGPLHVNRVEQPGTRRQLAASRTEQSRLVTPEQVASTHPVVALQLACDVPWHAVVSAQ